MRIKTIIIILVTVILTIVIVQNSEQVNFSLLWATFRLSKLIIMLAVAVIAFILGVLVGRPNKVKRLGSEHEYDDHEKKNSNTLSDEDRDYIG